MKTFNRQLLITPRNYYCRYFTLPKHEVTWFSVRCCFHDDLHPSLRINLQTGAFRCFGCGAKGCDVLAFHQMRHQMNFIEAVNFFGAWHE